jgi:hypothetical protein
MAIPMGVQDFVESAVKARFNTLQILETAERECWSAFAISRSRSLISHFRECALMLVSLIALQTSLGHINSKESHIVRSLLGETHFHIYFSANVFQILLPPLPCIVNSYNASKTNYNPRKKRATWTGPLIPRSLQVYGL